MPYLPEEQTRPELPSGPRSAHELRRVGAGLALIVATFVFIVASLLLIGNARSKILSAVRAYVAGEGLYSKGQKDAIHHLHRYARTSDERDYQEFRAALAIPLGDRKARIELEKPNPDMTAVYDGFLAAHNHPDDVANMAMLLRHFRHVSYIETAVGAWAQGDALVMRLGELGDALRAEIHSQHSDSVRITRILDELDTINKQLTVLEDRFSESLGEGNRWLEQRLAQMTYGVAALFVLGGILLSWTIYRRISDTERERSEAEHALRTSEERYRSLVAVTTSVVWTTDAEGAVRSPQSDWEAYTGQSWNEHARLGWLEALHPEDRDRIREIWLRARAEREVFRCEGRIMHGATGTYRHFVAHAVPLLNADGSIREWIGTLTDVDERRRAEEALRAASRQKDEFLAMLAHELRNPLSPIRNAVYILRSSGSTEPRITHALEMIERQVAHMSRLLDDLLDVSRVARGKIALREEVLDLAQLVRLTVEDYRPTLEAAGLRLRSDIEERPLWIRGDATRIAQIVGNLLHNALKFTSAGGAVEVCLRDDDDDAARLSIKDSGIGVEPAQLQRVFDVFTQAEQGLDRSRGGLGLGLALVRGLVHLHGGRAEAFSAGVGKGFEVVVRLPHCAAPGTTYTPPPPAEHVASHCRRVLVVEDNVDVAESVRELLELKGHEVLVAHTGAEALALARARRPEVVLCDIGLPGGMNGFDLAETFRHDRTLGSACLIAITGYGRSEDRKRAHEAGFDMHLIKPIDPAVLDRLLARASERIVA